MSQSLKILFSLILTALVGCSSITLQQPEPEGLMLLPPAQGPADSLLKQRVTMEAWGKQRQFLVVTRFQQDRVKLVALLPTGQNLLSLEYDGDELTQESLTSMDIPGEDILAIMQFALWPEASIKQHYSTNEGWIVTLSPQQRTLLTAAGRVLNVSYQQSDLIVDNYLHDYRVRIHTLEKTQL